MATRRLTFKYDLMRVTVEVPIQDAPLRREQVKIYWLSEGGVQVNPDRLPPKILQDMMEEAWLRANGDLED